MAVAVTVTTPRRASAVRRLVAALRAGRIVVPIIVGGSGIDDSTARRVGADAWGDDAPRLLHLLAERIR
jgi:methanogenic corrinoid protein MtbC1